MAYAYIELEKVRRSAEGGRRSREVRSWHAGKGRRGGFDTELDKRARAPRPSGSTAVQAAGPETNADATVDGPAPDTDDARPTIRRIGPQLDPKKLIVRSDPPPPPPKPTIGGVLQHIDCLGLPIFAFSQAESGSFAITDPQMVIVKGSPTGTLDLTCGPQKPKTVILEYEIRNDPQLGTAGVVRSIEFK
jgi:hypothetical protein